jgi:hypothetical protein
MPRLVVVQALKATDWTLRRAKSSGLNTCRRTDSRELAESLQMNTRGAGEDPDHEFCYAHHQCSGSNVNYRVLTLQDPDQDPSIQQAAKKFKKP